MLRIKQIIYIASIILLLNCSIGYCQDVKVPGPESQWEYGTLIFSSKTNTWEQDKIYIFHQNANALYTALGGDLKKLKRSITVTTFLNLLGKQGWELVSVQLHDDRNKTREYYFKRKREK